MRIILYAPPKNWFYANRFFTATHAQLRNYPTKCVCLRILESQTAIPYCNAIKLSETKTSKRSGSYFMTNNRNLFRRPFPSHADRNVREAKLEEAMDTYGEHIIGFFTRSLGDAHRAEELALSLWNHVHRTFKIEQFCEPGLLYYAGRQILGKEFRRRKARKAINAVELRPDDHDQPSIRNFATEDDERLARESFWEIFYGLDLLEQHKEAFWLKYIHGYTITELAERFDVSRSVVHDWITKLKEKCRKHLTGE